MKTDDLIQQLSGNLKPVKLMLSPLRMLSLFILIGLILIGLSFLLMTMRIDLLQQFSNPGFVVEISISFLLGLSALTLSVILSRPDHGNNRRILQLRQIGTITFLFLIYSGYQLSQMGQNQIFQGLNLFGLECFSIVLGYGVLLATAMLIWLRHGASVNPALSGMAVGIAGVAMGNITISFFCGIDNSMHIFMWHFALPLTAAVGAGIIAGKTILKW